MIAFLHSSIVTSSPFKLSYAHYRIQPHDLLHLPRNYLPTYLRIGADVDQSKISSIIRGVDTDGNAYSCGCIFSPCFELIVLDTAVITYCQYIDDGDKETKLSTYQSLKLP